MRKLKDIFIQKNAQKFPFTNPLSASTCPKTKAKLLANEIERL